MADATDDILAIARRHEFALAGVSDAAPSAYGDHVRRWIAAGKHGSLDWLADELDVRLDPARLLSGARSVICVADRYAPPGPDRRVDAWPPRGRIARYARGGDYHTVIRDRLRRFAATLRERYPEEEFRIACDLLPLLERELAARAGLGRIGKHTLLIEDGGTSYVLLGEIVTTLALRTTPRAPGDPCGGCTRCIDACPTQAITPYSVDASRCLSYTTIEHRGAIPAEFLEPTGDWLFGCDVCQEVCPHTAPTRRKRSLSVLQAYAPRAADFDLLDVLGWTNDDRLGASMRSALRRARLDMLKRNALVCLGNALRARPDAEILRRIAAIAADVAEPELVRDEATRTLARLGHA
ncbi:MAG: tRNA epoxyqueuosine(34) reductase QueG [Phycisphaerae bacterium]|nr:tRNA epoxyqueuosine(34) reductase QueG [Phycisphaerae bacterium]